MNQWIISLLRFQKIRCSFHSIDFLTHSKKITVCCIFYNILNQFPVVVSDCFDPSHLVSTDCCILFCNFAILVCFSLKLTTSTCKLSSYSPLSRDSRWPEQQWLKNISEQQHNVITIILSFPCFCRHFYAARKSFHKQKNKKHGPVTAIVMDIADA